MNQELEKKFEELKETNKRLAGEYAYVLAVKYHNDDAEKSRYYAQECLKIFEELDIQTKEDAMPRLGIEFDGVLLPGYMHKGTVRRELEGRGILR